MNELVDYLNVELKSHLGGYKLKTASLDYKFKKWGIRALGEGAKSRVLEGVLEYLMNVKFETINGRTVTTDNNCKMLFSEIISGKDFTIRLMSKIYNEGMDRVFDINREDGKVDITYIDSKGNWVGSRNKYATQMALDFIVGFKIINNLITKFINNENLQTGPKLDRKEAERVGDEKESNSSKEAEPSRHLSNLRRSHRERDRIGRGRMPVGRKIQRG